MAPAPVRPRVLQVSYSCGPRNGSEPGSGWNRALEAARYCDVCVITCEQDWGPTIRDYLQREGQIPGLEFEFVEHGKLGQWLARIPGCFYLAYHLWHRRALRVARERHETRPFALAHQVTFIGFREPGYAWKLPVPFVWGPIGGTQNYPWRFLWGAGWKTGLIELFRSLANATQLYLSPRVRIARRRAALVLVANETVRRQFAAAHPGPTHLLPDVGLRSTGAAIPHRRDAGGPLRVLWAGNLEARKAPEILLEAVAALPPDLSVEVRVAGSGPLEKRLRRRAIRLGVEARILWLGRLTHAEALSQFQWADVFVFTSLRDTTGTVVVEALGAGIPVVSFDHQGVGDIIDESCGIKIPVTSRTSAIAGFRHALTQLARDRRLLAQLQQGALRRAAEYEWSRAGQHLVEFYRQVLADAGTPWCPQARESDDSPPDRSSSATRAASSSNVLVRSR